jgi:pseudoazurin
MTRTCSILRSAGLAAAICFASFPAAADELQVKELNRGSAGFFVFEPELIRINPGDTIEFVATDSGHDVHSINGMIPDGARPFEGKTNENTKVTFDQPGVYVVACSLHTRMGMVGMIVVGDPVNIDKIDPSALPPKAKTKVQTLLEQINKK